MFYRLLSVSLLMQLIAATAHGADLEISPFAGYRFGGSLDDRDTDSSIRLKEGLDWGVIIGREASLTTHNEIFYSRQRSGLADVADKANAFDLDIHYLHLGGSVDLYQDEFTPFVSGGLGLTHMHPSGADLDNETHFSLSLGGGLKWYPSTRFGVRFEIRGFETFTDSQSRLFCDSDDCNIQIRGDVMSQFETNLGLFFRF